MTVLRWERSQRGVSDHLLKRLCELYNRPMIWFLTLDEGDLGQESGSSVRERIRLKIADAPASQRSMIEKVVEDMLDGLKRAS